MSNQTEITVIAQNVPYCKTEYLAKCTVNNIALTGVGYDVLQARKQLFALIAQQANDRLV